MADGLKGKVGEFGYEEFDSKSFGAVSAEDDDGDEPAAKEESEEGEKPVAKTEAEGEESAAADDGEGEGTESAEETEGEEKPAAAAAETPAEEYKPNVKYKSYDQEKDFPDWVKPMVKDAETEEKFRDLLSKADGLEGMKPRHQQTVQERDQIRQENEWRKSEVTRVLTLRDKNPALFFAELGVSDDSVVSYARKIVEAAEKPETWSQFDAQRRAEIDAYQQQRNAEFSQSQARNAAQTAHETVMQAALQQPQVAAFEQQYDKVYGNGSFKQRVAEHGSWHYAQTRQVISPYDAVQKVYEMQSRGFQPPAPAGTPAAAAATPAGATAKPAAQVVVKPRDGKSGMPNLGKGRNASPTGAGKPKTIKAMRAKIDRELSSLDE